MPLCGGRSGAGTGQGWGTLWSPPWLRAAHAPPLPSTRPLHGCSWPPLRRLTGFQSELRNPGLSCKHLEAYLCSGPVPPTAAPSPGAGRKASAQLLHLLARGPGPHPVAHAHSPAGSPCAPAASALGLWQLCPPRDNRLLPPPVAFTISSSARRGFPEVLSAPSEPQSAAVYSRCPNALPQSPPGAGPVLNVSLAATSPSLWTRAGSGRERRGEERPPAPRDGSWHSWRKQVCSQPSSHQHLMPGCHCAPSCGAARGSPCSPERGLWALLAFPCTITGFPGGPRPAGWRLQPRFVLSRAVAWPCRWPWLAGARGQDHPHQQSSSPGPKRLLCGWAPGSPPTGPRALAVEQRCPSPRLSSMG